SENQGVWTDFHPAWDASDSVYRMLLGALPNTKPHRIAGVTPDLVGEAFVYRILTHYLSDDAHCSCVARLAGKFGERVLAFLLRALLDFPESQYDVFVRWIARSREAFSQQQIDVPGLLRSEIFKLSLSPSDTGHRLLASYDAKANTIDNSPALSSTGAWFRENINIAIETNERRTSTD
ncbi:MAG TPA: hypothetical protein PLP12_18500, partial [Verrucomicrobiota bacterium]|nr:hypothetical protein [Verrucomicrobiota bacterium]